MQNLICKVLLILAIVDFSFCKKNPAGTIDLAEVRKDYKFKPPTKAEYAKILKAAKDDKEDVQQDELDQTYVLDKDLATRAGTSNLQYRWPYEMTIQVDPAYPKDEMKVIMSSIETLNKAMKCFSFYVVPASKKLKKDQDYLYIKMAGSGCHSKLGRRGGRQETVVSKGCFKKLYGTTIHEIMHVLGFFHEHVRPDRDAWVTVKFDEIPAGDDGKKLQYDIRDEQMAFESEYDYESIMHYNLNNILTVNPKKKVKSGVKVGQRDHLSPKDIKRLNKMYPCDKNNKPLTTKKPKGRKIVPVGGKQG